MPYFNAQHLPDAEPEYVAWVDVMGTQASMSRSISATANFVFKLHVAALEAPHAGVQLYPVMDGLYAASPSQEAILEFLRRLFYSVAEEFNRAGQPLHRFLIRGGLAFGPVIHGSSIPDAASEVLARSSGYRQAILLGMPMVQAHQMEGTAPPFGLAIHESARSFAPAGSKPLHVVWWKWETNPRERVWSQLKQKLSEHLEWCLARCGPLAYPPDRANAHKQMVEQYFEE